MLFNRMMTMIEISRARPAAVAGSLVAFALLGGASCRLEPSESPTAAVEPHPVAAKLAKRIETPIDVDEPETCAVCHAAVYGEWTESMHARAHQDADPIFGAMRRFRLGLGQPIEGKCANCHAPRSKVVPEAAHTGVSCATCHNIEKIHPGEEAGGAKQIEFARNDRMVSARNIENGRSPVHSNGPAHPALADGQTLCLTCHGFHRNPAKVPVCTTGSELEQNSEAGTCVDCHMPEVRGPSGAVGRRESHRSHAFLGPHRSFEDRDRRILEDAADLSVRLERGRVRVTVSNRSGHAFPSGFPGRMGVVSVVGRDRRGRTVWKNFDRNPMKESPESVFNKVYADAEGRPTLPPLAKKLLRDSRLKPAEVRTLTFRVPRSVAEVEARLTYRLLPPPAGERIGLEAPHLTRPVPVAEARAVLPSR